MISHSATSTATLGPSGTQLGGSATESGTVELLFDESLEAETSDQVLAVSFAYLDVQAVWLLTTADLTLKTNTTGGTNTINLKAGVPYSWTVTCAYFANPFTADVTSFHVSCTPACRLRGIILTA